MPGAPAAARDTTPSQEDEPEAQEEEEEEEALADPVPIEQLSRADLVQMEDGELASAFVWWDDVQASDLDVYRQVLDAADDEKPPQRHLASNPLLLVQHLRGGHGRWVWSQKRLGSEYVPDFVIGEKSSGGFEWQWAAAHTKPGVHEPGMLQVAWSSRWRVAGYGGGLEAVADLHEGEAQQVESLPGAR